MTRTATVSSTCSERKSLSTGLAVLCLMPYGQTLPIYDTDLSTLPRVSPEAEGFSEDVVRTNLKLARDYRRIQNEF